MTAEPGLLRWRPRAASEASEASEAARVASGRGGVDGGDAPRAGRGADEDAVGRLGRAFAAERDGIVVRRFEARRDTWRVERAGDGWAVAVRGDRDDAWARYGMAAEAVDGLWAALRVSEHLRERMEDAEASGLLQGADVLNALAWGGDAVGAARLRVEWAGDRVVTVLPGSYVQLDGERLVAGLRGLEATGVVAVRRWEGGRGRLWLEVEYPRVPPVDVSAPDAPASGWRDLWRAGAVLVNVESGQTAARVEPVLFRDRGGGTLPLVVEGDAGRVRHDGRRRVGRGAGGDAGVTAGVLARLAAAAEAPFAEAARRLAQLHGVVIPEDLADDYLGDAGAGLRSDEERSAVRGQFGRGRGTAFRAVTAVVRVAGARESPARRLDALLPAGRFVWRRGHALGRGRGSARGSAPGSAPGNGGGSGGEKGGARTDGATGARGADGGRTSTGEDGR